METAEEMKARIRESIRQDWERVKWSSIFYLWGAR